MVVTFVTFLVLNLSDNLRIYLEAGFRLREAAATKMRRLLRAKPARMTFLFPMSFFGACKSYLDRCIADRGILGKFE